MFEFRYEAIKTKYAKGLQIAQAQAGMASAILVILRNFLYLSVWSLPDGSVKYTSLLPSCSPCCDLFSIF